MTIDDSEISTMLKSAHEKLTVNGMERTKLKQFINRCTEIIQTPTTDDPKVMKDIMDDTLEVEMSTDRRQAIYDKLLVDKTTLKIV